MLLKKPIAEEIYSFGTYNEIVKILTKQSVVNDRHVVKLISSNRRLDVHDLTSALRLAIDGCLTCWGTALMFSQASSRDTIIDDCGSLFLPMLGDNDESRLFINFHILPYLDVILDETAHSVALAATKADLAYVAGMAYSRAGYLTEAVESYIKANLFDDALTVVRGSDLDVQLWIQRINHMARRHDRVVEQYLECDGEGLNPSIYLESRAALSSDILTSGANGFQATVDILIRYKLIRELVDFVDSNGGPSAYDAEASSYYYEGKGNYSVAAVELIRLGVDPHDTRLNRLICMSNTNTAILANMLHDNGYLDLAADEYARIGDTESRNKCVLQSRGL